jgi:hypothetical protein
MGWRIFDEAVDVVDRRFEYFPDVFRWRGRRFRAESVERTWLSLGRLQRRAARRFFLVRCQEGAFELFQDLETGDWGLRRAKFISPTRAAIRLVAPAFR